MTELEQLQEISNNLVLLGDLLFYLSLGLMFGLGWIAGHQR